MHDNLQSLLVDRGSAYVRVSTDDQDGARQRGEIGKFLDREGLTIDSGDWYVDEGWARDRTDRPEFQRLLAEVERGRIRWIVVDQPDRFAAADKLEFFANLHRLAENGCALIVTDGRVLTDVDDFGAFVTVANDADRSEKEGRDKSHRVQSKFALMDERGEYKGGFPPFAMDVGVFSGEAEVWRIVFEGRNRRVKVWPDGTTERFDGKGNNPPTRSDEVRRLVPSRDSAKSDAVRETFERFATEAVSLGALAVALNRAGFVTATGAKFVPKQIVDMLSHPVYKGTPIGNRLSYSKFTESKRGKLTPIKRTGKRRKSIVHDREDWIEATGYSFPPIVEQDVWDRVQVRLGEEKREREASSTRRAKPVKSDALLSGLLKCARCGESMLVHRQRRRNGDRVLTYFCGSYKRASETGGKAQCNRNTIAQDDLLPHVEEFLADVGADLSTIKNSIDTGDFTALEGVHERFSNTASELVRTYERMAAFVLTVEPDRAEAVSIASAPSKAALGTALGVAQSEVATWTKELHQAFAELFPHGRRALEIRRVTLDDEHTELTNTILRLDESNRRALAKAKTRLDELERELDRLDELLEDHEARLAQLRREVSEAQDRVQRAKADLRGGRDERTLRRTAAAIRDVIDHIELEFQPTGKKVPAAQLESIAIIPRVEGHTTREISGNALVTTGHRGRGSRRVPSSRGRRVRRT